MLPEALVFLTVAGEVFLLVLVGVEGVDELLVEDDMVRGLVFCDVVVVVVIDCSLTMSLLEILILVVLLSF